MSQLNGDLSTRLREVKTLRWVVAIAMATTIYLLFGTPDFRVPLIMFDATMALFAINEVLPGK